MDVGNRKQDKGVGNKQFQVRETQTQQIHTNIVQIHTDGVHLPAQFNSKNSLNQKICTYNEKLPTYVHVIHIDNP